MSSAHENSTKHCSITLSNSHLKVLIDEDDFDMVSAVNWRLQTSNNYAVCDFWKKNEKRREEKILMHRFILGLFKPTVGRAKLYGDHINKNGLDNRRENLRIVTPAQNTYNARSVRRVSPYRGIYKRRDRRSKLWAAEITVSGQKLHLGGYNTPEEAARAYNRAAIEHFGIFAYLNGV